MCVDLDGECLARRDRTLVAPRSQAVAALGQITIATQNAGVLPALLSCLTEIRRLVDAALGVEAAMAGNRPADESSAALAERSWTGGHLQQFAAPHR
jgi:hypothetical protein